MISVSVQNVRSPETDNTITSSTAHRTGFTKRNSHSTALLNGLRDGSAIAYIKFDESDVREFQMNMFEGQSPALKQNELYPSNYVYKYPKAGEQKFQSIRLCLRCFGPDNDQDGHRRRRRHLSSADTLDPGP